MAYALLVAMLSLAGGAIPLVYRPGHSLLQIYISLSAGALLGAALFHLLPEASEHLGAGFGGPAALGIVGVFLLQRYLAPHSHEPRTPRRNAGDEGGENPGHAQGPAGVKMHEGQDHTHPYGPYLGGVVAIAALSIHSFFDGVALAAAVSSAGPAQAVTWAVFFSVLVHKPMDSLAVSVLLMHVGAQAATLWAIQLAFALLVPIGLLSFQLTQAAMAEASAFLGYTLGFSAGTFLAIALTDLLPELHFHRHDRHKLSAAVLAGLGTMWLASLLGHAAAPP